MKTTKKKKIVNKLSPAKQAKNAIRWIDSLKVSEGFQKTTGKLGGKNDPNMTMAQVNKDPKNNMSYCCLGVACRVMGHNNIDFGMGFYGKLTKELGLHTEEGAFLSDDGLDSKPIKIGGEIYYGIAKVNDVAFRHDNNFVGIRKVILGNLGLMFVPEVAKLLKTHYKRK